MQDELEYIHEYYRSVLHKEWCDLLSTIEVKGTIKRDTTQIKRLETSKAESNSDRYEYIKVQRKKIIRTCALPNFKQKGEMTPNDHVVQHFCVFCKK